MLTVNRIHVFYKKSQALWDVSFKTEEKEIVVILGANGAGKSTALNTLAGLKHPSSGTIELLGRRIEKMPPHRIVDMSLSLVPEGGAFFPKMTIAENLELGAYCRKEKKEKQESLEAVYRIFPILRQRAQKLALTLSGGERQMLAIGRGLMMRPKLFMLDEPSYGLAPLMVAEIFRVIRVLREQGTTILLVEQNVKHTLRIADRAYLLENGKIVLEGTCKQFLEDDYVKQVYLGL
jgi:branched-chain amino acid transport system ATP-binding protein